MSEDAIATGLAGELLDEVIGASNRKWAIALVCLFLGAVGALWLVRRSRSRAPEVPTEMAAEAAA